MAGSALADSSSPGVPSGDETAGFHHDDSVGQEQGFGHVVGHHHRGEAETVVQGAVVAAEGVTGGRVEGAERLVHQHDGRARAERTRHADALPLAA